MASTELNMAVVRLTISLACTRLTEETWREATLTPRSHHTLWVGEGLRQPKERRNICIIHISTKHNSDRERQKGGKCLCEESSLANQQLSEFISTDGKSWFVLQNSPRSLSFCFLFPFQTYTIKHFCFYSCIFCSPLCVYNSPTLCFYFWQVNWYMWHIAFFL